MRPTIYASCHEPKELIDLIRNRYEVIVKNITPGDYVSGDIGIERKTLGDFFESWKSGRLYDQLSRLGRCYATAFLIIEVFDLSFFKKPHLVYRVLIECIYRYDTIPLFTRCMEETVDVICSIFDRACKGRYAGAAPPPVLTKEISIYERRLMMLCCIKGIGKKKAERVLAVMGSLQRAFNADEEALKVIKGIGRETAKEIKKTIL